MFRLKIFKMHANHNNYRTISICDGDIKAYGLLMANRIYFFPLKMKYSTVVILNHKVSLSTKWSVEKKLWEEELIYLDGSILNIICSLT